MGRKCARERVTGEKVRKCARARWRGHGNLKEVWPSDVEEALWCRHFQRRAQKRGRACYFLTSVPTTSSTTSLLQKTTQISSSLKSQRAAAAAGGCFLESGGRCGPLFRTSTGRISRMLVWPPGIWWQQPVRAFALLFRCEHSCGCRAGTTMCSGSRLHLQRGPESIITSCT